MTTNRILNHLQREPIAAIKWQTVYFQKTEKQIDGNIKNNKKFSIGLEKIKKMQYSSMSRKPKTKSTEIKHLNSRAWQYKDD